jgi:Ca2+-binding RTX toxin-like protein
VNDSIIVGNNGVGLPNDVGGRAFASNGHNLFGSDVAGNVAGDLENVGAAAVFARTVPVPGGTPVLGGAPSDYGGPTDTVELLDSASNPALGRGSVGGPDTDQRGEPRPAPPGTAPDIGAFELQDAPPALVGGARGERLLGTADDEHLRGLAGDDRLFGRGAGDRLDGGRGDDRLHGGGEGDLLRGGGGADRFVFWRAGDSTDDEQDLVLDFSHRQGDRLDLRGLDGDPTKDSDQRLAFVGRDAFDGPGEVRYTLEPGHTVVEVNLDRDAGAELAFRLDRAVDLHVGDFLL